MPQPLSTSAALRFTELELGGPCMEVATLVPIFAGQDNIVVQQNPDRVGLIMMNNGSTDCYVSILPVVITGNGLLLSGAGGVISMNVRDDFTIPSREWHAGSTGPNFIMVIEIIRFSAQEYNT